MKANYSSFSSLARTVFTAYSLRWVMAIALVPPLIFALREGLDGLWGGPMWVLMGKNFAYSLLFTASLYYGSNFIMAWLNEVLPWKNQVMRRLALELLLILSYASVVQVLIVWLCAALGIWGPEEALSRRSLFDTVLFGNAITLIVVSFFEGVYFFEAWRESLLQAERVEKENLRSQYENLRAQLDPHFMFNSLNVLSSLIRKDPALAEAFIDDFAAVYRYLLEVRDEELVRVEEEWRFSQQYLRLQKIRFPQGLQVIEALEPEALKRFVPPLSLQELISNALKHNVVRAKQALTIELRVEGNMLLVRNNLQPRQAPEAGTGLGMRNLTERYRLLGAPEMPSFGQSDTHFEARIPLLDLD